MKFFTEESNTLISGQALAAEQKGQLTEDMLSLIYREKLFKLFIPKQLNGRQMSLPEALKLEIEASTIDGGFGWSVMIGAGGGYFAGFIDPEINQQLFSEEKAVVAGSGQPSAIAEKKDHHYQVNGQWKYCSGVNYATLLTANCQIKENGKADNIKAFIFRPEQIEILPDWNAYGMKATGSHSMKVVDAEVPAEMTFDISKPHRQYDYAVYDYPFYEFAQLTTLTVVIGCCQHFLEEAKTIADNHKAKWEAVNADRYNNFLKTLKAKQNKLETAVNQYYELAEKSWQLLLTKNAIDESVLEAIQQKCPEVRNIALEAAQAVYGLLGMSAVMKDSAVNRSWRDLHTASQHMLLNDYKASS